ncbi:MAG TPA: hypothetical protein VH279_02065 [Solirubrobacteraceae bacterium]|jgi:hypothetical protein|nr:hypothetical protein [Solirubrobacteraceae bacterium]
MPRGSERHLAVYRRSARVVRQPRSPLRENLVEVLAFKREQLVAQRVLCAAELSCDVEQLLSMIRFR